jgi:hypothetical protein
LFNLLLCSHFNFLHLMKCQVGIWCCKRGLLQRIRTQGALIYFYHSFFYLKKILFFSPHFSSPSPLLSPISVVPSFSLSSFSMSLIFVDCFWEREEVGFCGVSVKHQRRGSGWRPRRMRDSTSLSESWGRCEKGV